MAQNDPTRRHRESASAEAAGSAPAAKPGGPADPEAARATPGEAPASARGVEVRVTFFGSLADAAGLRSERVVVAPEGDEPPTVAALRSAVARRFPDVAPHLAHTAVGRGTELVSDAAALRPGEEIALLPPVSGG